MSRIGTKLILALLSLAAATAAYGQPTTTRPPATMIGSQCAAGVPLVGAGAGSPTACSGPFAFSGALTPTALAGDVNDYNPTNLSTAVTLRIDGGASDRNITGLAGGSDGRVVRIVNIGTTNNLTLKDQSSSSSAANRFVFGADVVIAIGKARAVVYDTTSSRWRPFDSVLANSGVTAGTYGDSTHVAQVTVDAQGRITSASNVGVSAGITALTGDVTASGSGSVAATVVNIPTGTTQAGQIVGANIAAPSTPASAHVTTWMDSTDLRLHDKNAAGVTGTTVVADTGAANNYISAISAAGVTSKSRPACATLSDAGVFCNGTAASGLTGQTAIANGGTGQATATAAFDALAPTPTRAGDIAYWNGTHWVTLPGNNSGTLFLQETSSGVPSWATVSGSGTVTSLTPGNGLTSTLTATAPGSAITTTGTLSAAQLVNPQSGTSYAIVDGDRAKLVTAVNAAAQAYSIAQAGTASAFEAGWYVDIQNNSTNVAGVVTVTPAIGSTINGVATLKIQPGQFARIVSDGTNYQVKGPSSSAQLPGTTTNDSANAGNVGELMSNSAGSVSLTSATVASMGTISLTAGDWDITCGFNLSGSSNPAVTAAFTAINTVNNAVVNTAGQAWGMRGSTWTDPIFNGDAGPLRVSLSGSTSYFCNAVVTWTTGTFNATGTIRARRIR